MIWAAVLLAALGCYLLKLAGLSIPGRLLQGRRARHLVALVPVGLLGALIATQTFATGDRLQLDARAAGLAVAAIAIWLRLPFLVIVVLAVAVTALLRSPMLLG